MPKQSKSIDLNVSAPESTDSGALAVNRRKAAAMLGISERLLWTWTNMKRIPHVRVGARVLYPLHMLREWLHKNADSAAK